MLGKLKRMKVENFKGIKNLEVKFNDDVTTILGRNETGKTSLRDAYFWCLVGKNSNDEANFAVRTLDDENHPILGIITTVRVEFEGKTFQRELHDKTIKDEFRGFTSVYKIDDEPVKASEFDIGIDETQFKLLSMLEFFSESPSFTWKDRRQELMKHTAVKIEDYLPKWAEDFDETEKKLNRQLKTLQEKRDDYPSRIDEINNFATYIGSKEDLHKLIEELKQTLQEKQSEYQRKIEKKNNQIHTIQEKRDLLLEKNKQLLKLQNENSLELNKLDTDVLIFQQQNSKDKISKYEDKIKSLEKKKEEYRKQWKELNQRKDLKICNFCGQTLPEIMQKQALEKAKNSILKEATNINTEIIGYQNEIKKLLKDIKRLKREITENNQKSSKLKSEIEKLKKEYESNNEKLSEMENEITAIEKSKIQIERPEIIDDIREEITKYQNELKYMNRKEELEQKQQDVISQINNLKQKIDAIITNREKYIRKLEDELSKNVKKIKFKLFQKLMNGSYRETCEILYQNRRGNLVDYSNLNTGGRILTNIRLVKFLSRQYGMKLPIWIDNTESLDIIPERDDFQFIMLKMQKTKTELEII